VWIGSSFCRCEGAVLYMDAGTDRMLWLFLCLSQDNFYIAMNRSRYQIDIISIVVRSCSCVVLHMMWLCFSLFFVVSTHVLFHLFFIVQCFQLIVFQIFFCTRNKSLDRLPLVPSTATSLGLCGGHVVAMSILGASMAILGWYEHESVANATRIGCSGP
jgi:hypothetical protein